MKHCSILFAILLIFSAGFLRADTAPAEKLKSTVDAALDVAFGECCQDLSQAEKRTKVRECIEAAYDLEVLIRRAMGRNWNLLDETEQAQTVDLVKNLIIKAYFDSIEGRARPEVSFGKTIEVTASRLEIPSTIRTDGKTYSVLYRLGRLQSGWQIYDIVAEDISIVANYRQQFDDHFRRGSGKQLITKLENLLAQPKLDDEIKL